jgi:hypothetical protein
MALGGPLQASIVSGGDVGRPETPGDLGQMGELHGSIAAHAGNRRSSCSVVRNERIDDVPAKSLSLVQHVVGNSQLLASPPGILSILGGAASTDLLVPSRVPEV